MKLLKLLTITIVTLQFVYQPIAISQVWYDEPTKVQLIDDLAVKLKNAFRREVLRDFTFLDKNKNSVSIDELIRLKDKTFYVLSPERKSKAEQFAVKIKISTLSKEKITIALQAFDKNIKTIYGTQSFVIDSKNSKNFEKELNKKLKILSNSVERKRGITSANQNFTEFIGYVALVVGISIAIIGLVGLYSSANRTGTSSKPHLLIIGVGVSAVLIASMVVSSSGQRL